MEIRKTGNPIQDNCSHEFEIFVEGNEKTCDGFYKENSDYKPGQLYNMYICKKCSRIVTVSYTKENDNPVLEFAQEYPVAKKRTR